jgi:hypothetical protein
MNLQSLFNFNRIVVLGISVQPLRLIILTIILLLNGCIVQFIPEINEEKELLVVEGLITNQPEVYKIKLSKSLPLGAKNAARPLRHCLVTISDNLFNTYNLIETVPGTYVTDSTTFQGKIGVQYTLRINSNNIHYQSMPMEIVPVPAIDSIYYEKKIFREATDLLAADEGYQVYLNTHDPGNNCKYFRWNYSETWEFTLPYDVVNKRCWITNNSDRINIKNTSVLAEDRVERFPLNYISNETDKLRVKYSLLVNQYSLNEDEYIYWEKLQNISEQVGGLYDIIPSAIPSNVSCIEDPAEKVLGYFSVSAKATKRIFIIDYFPDLINLYSDCAYATVPYNAVIPNLNIYVWIIEDNSLGRPPNKVLTDKKGCADCSVRGSTKEPAFWKESK